MHDAIDKFNETKAFVVYPVYQSNDFINKYKDVLDIIRIEGGLYCSKEKLNHISFSKFLTLLYKDT